MVTQKIIEAFNTQIKLELESAYIYLAMAAYFHDQNLDGMAQWMRVQAQEEQTHAMKFFDHLVDRGARVELQTISQPKSSWNSPLEVFEEAYQHEMFVTGKINDLVKLATAEDDYPGLALLQWFVTEQVEEEASTSKVAQQLKMLGSSGSGLVMFDRQLGKREE